MIEEITQPHQKVEDRVVQDPGTGERSQKKAHLGKITEDRKDIPHLHDLLRNVFNPKKDFGWDKVVVDGFDQIIDGIVSGIDAEFPIVIELQAIVRQITFDKKTNKYKIRTFDRQQHEADIVIVAVPLGILRKGEIVFGEPQTM